MPNITFAINGITKKQGPSPLNIAGTYQVSGETIKIDPVDATHLPLIQADEALDRLWLQNAVISSSSAPIVNVKFSFSSTFASLNVGIATYSVEGSGIFTRSQSAADPKDWISARGFVEATVLGSVSPDNLTSPPPNPPLCTKKLTACATESMNSWIFNLAQPNLGFKVGHNFGSNGIPQLPAGSNDLKVEFWISLGKPSDKLTITTAPGLRVKFGPPSGEDEIEPEPEPDNRSRDTGSKKKK